MAAVCRRSSVTAPRLHGHPAICPEPPVRSGWRRDGQRRWYVVDACALHGDHLLQRPLPAAADEPMRIASASTSGAVLGIRIRPK